MRILLVVQYFLPEPQKLLAELATTLRERGHTVAVLTGFPHWPAGKLYPGYRIRVFEREEIEGITIFRVPIYPDHSSSALRRTLNALSLALSGMLVGPLKLPRFDVIHAISPPFTMAPAWVLSKCWGVPFTYEVQDMFPETLAAVGMVTNPIVLKAIDQCIGYLYRRAAAIRVISSGFRRHLETKGIPGDRLYEVANWVDPDFYGTFQRDPNCAELPALCGKFNIMFAGNIGLAQGLDVVLRTAHQLRDLSDVQFVFIGDGVELPRLKEIQAREEIRNALFLGRFPPERMPRLLSHADVLLIHLRDDPLFRITIPLKTLTYLAAGRPILAAARGDVADLVERAGAGIACDPGNADKLAAAVRLLHSLPRRRLEEFGDNGRRAACTVYSRHKLVEDVEAMLQSAVSAHRCAVKRRAPV